jgi:hypothetical protein
VKKFIYRVTEVAYIAEWEDVPHSFPELVQQIKDGKIHGNMETVEEKEMSAEEYVEKAHEYFDKFLKTKLKLV